jgi:hypothetical protein
MTAWELLGAIAYTLCFALFESLILLLVVTLVSCVLPSRFIGDSFVVKGSGLLYVSIPWVFFLLVEIDPWLLYLIPVAGLLLSWGLFYKLLREVAFVQRAITGLVDRLTLLSYLYLTLDLLAILVVIARNLTA